MDDRDGGSFDIDTTNGQIKTKDALDHEAKASYAVTVSVTDSRDESGNTEQTPSPDDTHTVTITVTDEDDLGAITFSPEQPIAGTTLTATLTDQDGVQSEDTWQWEISDDQSTWAEITDATTSSFVPGSGDIGKFLRITVTYTQTDSSTKTVEDETGAILTAPSTNTDAAFADLTATRSIPENTPAGQPVGASVTAEEPDNEDTLTYSLGGTDSGYFEIDTGTGQVKTKAELDYETTQTYSVTVSVTDSKDDYDYADATVDDSIAVDITVTDVNEKPQFDENLDIELSIPEDTPVGQDIGNALTATDPDTGDTVAYSVSGTDSDLFEVDSNGQLQVKEALDFESKPSVTVIVSATDSEDVDGNTDTTADDTHTVTITVTDVFEAPRFDDDDGTGTATRSVPENTVADQPVGAPVSATDDERDTVTYELGGTDVASFAFNTTTGQIKTSVALDHESKDTYYVTVSAHDGKAADGTTVDTTVDATIDVTIEVSDVNEAPAFDANAVTELSVPENTPVDTDIGTAFTATDPDPADTLSYTLGGTDAESFDIDATSGQIKTNADLDHETKETYSVTVTVSDGRNDVGTAEDPPAKDATIVVTITVTDTDDLGTITLSSNQPPAGETLTAILEDDDGIVSEESWKWENSSDETIWETITGATTSSYIPQEEDEEKFLQVTVNYTDGLGADKTASEKTRGKVQDQDATNKSPLFALDATTTLSVQENTPEGENIGDPFTATDDDDSSLTYVLGGTDSASFDIVETSGQLQTKAELDFEGAQDTYSVTVSVLDSKDPFGNANTVADATLDVTINVTDMVIPTIPAAPTVEPTHGAAAGLSVTWTAITATADAPVDGYDVQYHEKDATPAAEWTDANVTVSGTTATITSLAYTTTYEVQVQARNSEGESDWSPTGEGSIPSELTVTFEQANYTVTEGNSATITVTVSPAADRALSIDISATSTNAESGDYSPTSTTVNFVSGETSQTFTISTTRDSDRDNETVSLGFGQLPAAVGPGTQSTAQLTIDDTTPAPSNNGGNNPSPLSVSFQQASYTVTEGSSRTITVNVSPAADRALSIRISASSSNAESGDYSVSGTPLVFASGDSSKTFTVSTTNDSDRDNETVSLGFGQLPAAVGPGTQSTAQLTIDDTTPAPSNKDTAPAPKTQ